MFQFPLRRTLPSAYAVLALAAAGATAGAQVIRGTVSSEGTLTPLRGAVVTLLMRDGRPTPLRVLSGPDGSFALRAPSAGTWSIEVRAIGFAVRRTNARLINAAETVVENVSMRQLATRLATLRIEARSACRRASELDAVTAEVWDDVWAALAASDIVREQRLVRADVFVYTREVDVGSGIVLYEERGVAPVLDARPFQTLPAADLVNHGFWRQPLTGPVEFHGLDAGTIIAPEFLATHCFALVRGDSAGTTRIGLAFRPVNSRSRADVQGTLWVNPDSRELRLLEFSYTGLQLRGPAAGGTIRFTRLESGLLVDDDWSLRHPFERTRPVGRRRTGDVPDESPVRRPGTAVRVAGGFVLTGTARTSQLAVLMGVVRSAGAPADAASVELLGSGQRVETDSTGAFVIGDVVPGTYEMRVVRPGPGDRGGFVQHGTLVVSGGDVARVTVEVPDADAIGRALCPDAPPGSAPLFGLLREQASGRAAVDYRIEVQWAPPVDSSGSAVGRAGAVRVLTDWRGEFVACNVPAGARASFRTTTGDAEWSLPIPMGAKLNVIEIGADTSSVR